MINEVLVLVDHFVATIGTHDFDCASLVDAVADAVAWRLTLAECESRYRLENKERL